MQFGAPRKVITDRGSAFIAKATRAYARIVPVKHRYSTPYHPKTNAVVERVNGTLGQASVRLSQGAVRHWDKFLPAATFAYRVRYHRILGTSPFQLLYGCQPLLPSFDAPSYAVLP